MRRLSERMWSSHLLLGWPGGRFQVWPGRLHREISICWRGAEEPDDMLALLCCPSHVLKSIYRHTLKNFSQLTYEPWKPVTTVLNTLMLRQSYLPILVVYVDLYRAFYAKRLKCAQTWITQFYLQITPCLPSLPSRRTSPPFGWYSFYRPTKGRRLSRPGWLVTYRNKVPPPGVEPAHGHPFQY